MTETIIGVAVVVVLVVGTVLERRRARRPFTTKAGTPNSELNEYLGGGVWRSLYDVFDGRNLDRYEWAHLEGVRIIRACDLVAKRMTGRWEGRSIQVEWHEGKDGHIDNCARWLLRHGEPYGVRVVRK